MVGGAERRRVPRHATMGLVAKVRCGEASEKTYSVGDLSRLGALLLGEEPHDTDAPIEVRLEAPGHGGVTVNGRVVRCFRGTTHTRLGVQFDPVGPDAQAFIDDAIHAEQLRTNEPLVLVVAACETSALTLWAELEGVGCSTRVVVSLEEGMRAVHDRDLPVCCVVIDARHGESADAVAFAEQVRAALPTVRVLLIGARRVKLPPSVERIAARDWTAGQRLLLFSSFAAEPVAQR